MRLKKKEGGAVLFDAKRSREFREAMHEGLRKRMLPILKKMDQDERRRKEMVNPNTMIGASV